MKESRHAWRGEGSMPNRESRDNPAFRMSRRKMMKGVAAVLGALALPEQEASASVWESFFQKHFDIIYEYLDFLDNSGLRMQDG